MKTEEARRGDHVENSLTLSMAAEFCMTSPEILRHLFTHGACPGARAEEAGGIMFPMEGLKELIRRNNVTCTRLGRTFAIRRFKGARPVNGLDGFVQVFSTSRAADEFEGMWRKLRGNVCILKEGGCDD